MINKEDKIILNENMHHHLNHKAFISDYNIDLELFDLEVYEE